MGIRLRRDRGCRELCRRRLGRSARPPRRQGRQPRRDDPDRRAGAARLHRHHRGLQRLPGGRRGVPRRHVGAGARRPSKSIEAKTGKTFGRSENPLLVSCRSGAKFSMPGHDGHGPQHRPERRGHRRHHRALRRPALRLRLYRRLIQMFGSVVLGVRGRAVRGSPGQLPRTARASPPTPSSPPTTCRRSSPKFKDIVRRYANIDFPADPYEQLRMATEAVFKSWNGKRALDYRNAAGIAHDLGTGGQHPDHGVRQHGRRLGHRRRHVPQRHHRRDQPRGRLPDQRPGRGRRRRHPADRADQRRSRRRCPSSTTSSQTIATQAREPLPQHAGHGVHHRARQALAAADPRRQAHRPGGRCASPSTWSTRA